VSRAALPAAAFRLATTRVDAGPAGVLALLDVPPAADVAPVNPVLLVPGFTGSKEDFGPLLPGLAAAGHRAVAVDLPGQFESAGGEELSSYDVDVLGRDLLALVAALRLGPTHLLGHSYGGLVARAAVLADPGAWASLTLLDSGPAALTRSRRASTELLAQAAATMDLGELHDGVVAYWASQGHPLPPAEGAAFQRERFTRTRRAALLAAGAALLTEPDRVDALAAAAARRGLPLAVVFGEDDDAWTPAEQTRMAERLGARCVPVPGAAHSPAYEATDVLLAVLTRFLDAAERASCAAPGS